MDSTPQPAPPSALPAQDIEQLFCKGLLILFLAIAVYIPAMSGGYIYDDDLLLTQNKVVRQGTGFFDAESWKGLATIWFPTTEESKQWINDYAPLSTTTLWIEWRLWGEGSPAGYHTTNILLHAAGALLLWAVLAQMGVRGAWLAGLVWAVHPVCVESVAWIAERRNVLSMPLLMLTLLAWLRFQSRPAGRRWNDYVLALALFAETLLAKSAVAMLPCFLLLWIWWKRDRVTKRDLLETAPFFLLSLALGVVTIWFQYTRAIADETVPVAALPHRLASACFALVFYAWKAALPVDLMFNYPEWHNTVPLGAQALGIVPFAVVFAWAWQERAGWGRHVILGLGFFVIMIAPALGILKMAYMRITLVADHFEYVPMAGLIALVAAGLACLPDWLQAPSSRKAVNVVAGCAVALLCCLTTARSVVFRDPEALWNDTLAKNPDAWQAHEHLGGVLSERRDLIGALEHFQRGVELRPWLGETHNNYGNTLRQLGANADLAFQENEKAAALSPKSVPVVYSYGCALAWANRPLDAIAQFQKVMQLQPREKQSNAMVCLQIGDLFVEAGDKPQAITYYQKALELDPTLDDARTRIEGLTEAHDK
ncbi:MAG TPA: tetratricopeptide repeat protein [Chthoniobacteraceae bacterium]|nr:tetratricopeptide repeat protein [Chthoniobacteraceae bacterium]